jgi:hypothetical protein
MGVGKEGTSTFYHSDASTKPFALTSEKIGTATYYYLYDGQGSVAALTNSSGTISAVDSYKYDPFGGKVSPKVASARKCTNATRRSGSEPIWMFL